MLRPDQTEAARHIITLQKICKRLAEDTDLTLVDDIDDVIRAGETLLNPPPGATAEDDDYIGYPPRHEARIGAG